MLWVKIDNINTIRSVQRHTFAHIQRIQFFVKYSNRCVYVYTVYHLSGVSVHYSTCHCVLVCEWAVAGLDGLCNYSDGFVFIISRLSAVLTLWLFVI